MLPIKSKNDELERWFGDDHRLMLTDSVAVVGSRDGRQVNIVGLAGGYPVPGSQITLERTTVAALLRVLVTWLTWGFGHGPR